VIRRLVTTGGLAAAVLLAASPALAHPLGNYSINHHLGVHVTRSAVTVTLLLDLAEIPAFQEKRVVDADADGAVDASEAAAYATATCGEHLSSVAVELATEPLAPVAELSSLVMIPGQAGLETARLECVYSATVDLRVGEETTVVARDLTYPDRIGWREVVISGEGVVISTDAFTTSPSRMLTEYPQGELMEVAGATAHVEVIGGPPGAGGDGVLAAPAPLRGPAGLLGSFLAAPGIGLGALALAMVAAFGLGLAHALAPGHGKTLMAAYLVGTRGSRGDAAALGLAVAVSHTVGVAVLGGLAFAAATTLRPEVVYPILSIVSATVIVAVGVHLSWRARRRHRAGRAHEHDHDHEHDHGHDHGHDHPAQVSWRSLAALGLSGGLVPSASAVVLLLGAINLGRVGVGVLLVFLFGLGMATALVAVGMAVVSARDFGYRRLSGPAVAKLRRRLPPIASGAVVVVGLVLLGDAVRGLGA
jgi:ABC-type nickel/cobalt efflux system permease component RcnA